MKTWLMISVMLALFVFGFYAIKKLAASLAEKQRMDATGEHRPDHHILIQGEIPELLEEISPALEYCSNSASHFKVLLGCETRSKMLRKLSDGTLDIALLTEASIQDLEPEYRFIQIPCQVQVSPSANELSKETPCNHTSFAMVWDVRISCSERDQVISLIEKEFCSLKCGYCDYMG